MGFEAVPAPISRSMLISGQKRNVPPGSTCRSEMQLFNNLGAHVEIEPSGHQQNRREMEPVLDRYSNSAAKIVE
ncbi:hypothetical protein [Collinsella sp. An307]|uniref:hypothetical protein n=1 Tax=Collinsella sp. An307 TaxID=1965630 RepID=UPI0011806F5A|nr:hypothetical protein [Collinsella sp. An307]